MLDIHSYCRICRIGKILNLRIDLYAVYTRLRHPTNLIGTDAWINHVSDVEHACQIRNIKTELCIVVFEILRVDLRDYSIELLVKIGIVVERKILRRSISV